MASVTVVIPDTFITLYQQRRATHNPYAVANGLRLMPPATVATIERIIRDYMKGLIRDESYRIDPGDGSIIDADEAAMSGV